MAQACSSYVKAQKDRRDGAQGCIPKACAAVVHTASGFGSWSFPSCTGLLDGAAVGAALESPAWAATSLAQGDALTCAALNFGYLPGSRLTTSLEIGPVLSKATATIKLA